MIVLLFDIDGTLLLTGGAGRIAMQAAMREIYQLEDLARVDVHGRTDFAIIRDLFDAHDIEHTQQSHSAFTEHYHEVLSRSMGEAPGRLMPGVHALLDNLDERNDVAMGLLTGNSQRGAEIKLDHYELGHYFQFGGYGDWHSNRNHVAKDAYENVLKNVDNDIPAEDVWIIGDTIHDIRCARSIGARVIAVETGNVCRDELARENPDSLLVDLSDPKLFLNALDLA